MSGSNQADSRKKTGRLFSIVLLLAGLGCIGYFLYVMFFAPKPPPPPPPSPSSTSEPSSSVAPAPSSSSEGSSSEEDPTIYYPPGKLFVTQERADYDGSMTLTLPRLGIENMPVLGDVSEETLEKGIGLYDYSQIPGTGNRNVSIAGHRDVMGKEFYYIDTVTTGDKMTISYQGKDYVYLYKDTYIVEESDWSPIYIQGFSCLSLTSCTPIGVASHRMIVRAELIEIIDQASKEVKQIPSASASEASSLHASTTVSVLSEAASVPSQLAA